MLITERIVCLIVASGRSGWHVRGEHAQTLLFKGVFVLGLNRIIYNGLEHLNDQKEKNVGATEQLTVFAICFTVADKHP